MDFPCFVHREADHTEILWGATYRITVNFLQTVFAFRPPDGDRLPVVDGALERGYLTGDVRSGPR